MPGHQGLFIGESKRAQEKRMTSEIQVQFALMIGSDLIRESALPSALPTVGTSDGIDGALIVNLDGKEWINERYWDRLDGLLNHLLDALEEALEGRESIALFPDTRVELGITPKGDRVHMTLENIPFEAPLQPFYQEIVGCARRFLELGTGLSKTDARQALEDRLNHK
jgi:hypothetical protein